jgi:anti-sigma B factor antagonist
VEIKQVQQDNERQVQLEGNLTIYDAQMVKENLLAALSDTQYLEIELSAISEIDSSGLQVLLLINREASEHEIMLKLVRPSEVIISLLRLYGLSHNFVIED